METSHLSQLTVILVQFNPELAKSTPTNITPRRRPGSAYSPVSAIRNGSIGSRKSLALSQNLSTLSEDGFIDVGEEIVEYLSQLLKERIQTPMDQKAVDDAIHSYNAVHTPEYREVAMEAFRSGRMRVMVCTEAAGMVS